MIQALFNRFKASKLNLEGHFPTSGIQALNTQGDYQIDMQDFFITCVLLARMIYEKKIKTLFEVCDDDNDGKLSPD